MPIKQSQFGVVAVAGLVAGITLTPIGEASAKKSDANRMKSGTFTGLGLRGIGPAVSSGRIGDIAVQPTDYHTWYVAVASGGVWKTVNAGTTWEPIFDGEGSYSIGCLAVDQRDPLIVWVGTGENNSQRSVGYGDGVYKSVDGGKNWQKLGLEKSEHVGKILLDPRDGNVVYVAAQGPLWSPGGDRGLYKSADGGATWKQVLKIDENTGVSDIVFDPRNPDVLYASAYQRRRHVWTLIDGGPGSAIYKTTDGGATWRKLQNGLPKDTELGRIGLAVSPADPNVVYAIIEAAGKQGGFYRSTDAGGTWEKRCDYVSESPQYYQEIVPDPRAVDRVYSMDTWMKITEDGGKTFRKVGEKAKHVDNHALWIEPENTRHLLAGCDGGVYESFDRGETWSFFDNLPVTQFYKVTVDNSSPIYRIYGGTQDNNTLGGPAWTTNAHGIRNSDWYVTVGGDGFQTRVDPEDPNIVYSQSQYGGLVRYDHMSGQVIDIQPQPDEGDPPLRWNWDSPLIISPHSRTRLYFAAQKLFRSDDRGDTWYAVSPDLTRQIDRNKLKVMGRVWSVDAVAKNASTSFYGNIVSLSESPLVEGLIYAGTDDGLIQITEDGGKRWSKAGAIPGIAAEAYVSYLTASSHDPGTVYAAFTNHKMGDFKPYLLKSTNRGRGWRSISGDLPERGSTWAVVEDPRSPELLFAGTEFGVFFTVDGGGHWVQLKGGIPVIAVRDLAIQSRENALVAATFGRGFYVLDDFSPLREVSGEALEQEAILFPTPPAWAYISSSPLGLKGKSFQGDGFYTAPNPPFGAVFTYYLRDSLETLREKRQKAERRIRDRGDDVFYPSWDELRREEGEETPQIVLTVCDAEGNVVNRVSGPATAGFHRVAWDLRFPPATPVELEPTSDENPFVDRPMGPLTVPGSYSVSLGKLVGGKLTPLAGPRDFTVRPLGSASLPEPDRMELLAFEQKTARLQRAVMGAVEVAKETRKRLDFLEKALHETPAAPPDLGADVTALRDRVRDLQVLLSGDDVIAGINEPTPPSIVDRVQRIVYGHWTCTAAPTETHRRAYEIASSQFADVLERLRSLVSTDLATLEKKADAAGAPWTPGRLPTWTPE
jgi:photosystem II stability/assembly factor-like uncharacterized protein